MREVTILKLGEMPFAEVHCWPDRGPPVGPGCHEVWQEAIFHQDIWRAWDTGPEGSYESLHRSPCCSFVETEVQGVPTVRSSRLGRPQLKPEPGLSTIHRPRAASSLGHSSAF